MNTAINKLLAAALLCGAAAAATPALAQSSTYYGAVDYGNVSLSGPGSYTGAGALTVSAGYRYLPNLNFEAGFTMVGAMTADVPGTGRVSVGETVLGVTAIGLYPVGKDVTLFGKAGAGLHSGVMSGLPDDLILGIGAQLQFRPRIAGRVQYETLGKVDIPSADYKADMSRLSVGAVVDF
jgi:hypothetical protein